MGCHVAPDRLLKEDGRIPVRVCIPVLSMNLQDSLHARAAKKLRVKKRQEEKHGLIGPSSRESPKGAVIGKEKAVYFTIDTDPAPRFWYNIQREMPALFHNRQRQLHSSS